MLNGVQNLSVWVKNQPGPACYGNAMRLVMPKKKDVFKKKSWNSAKKNIGLPIIMGGGDVANRLFSH